MSSDSIVGYTYAAQNLCPECTANAIGAGKDLNRRQIEETVRNLGAARGIDVDDERSYDSEDWPKVIFDVQVESPDEQCGDCGRSLIA